MASIQNKINKQGKKIFYVVVPLKNKRKWIRAGTKQQATNLMRQLSEVREEELYERLGFTQNLISVEDYFNRFLEFVKLHNQSSTLKRYSAIIHTFQVFLNKYYNFLSHISEIKLEHIEEYQNIRLNSLDLKNEADGNKIGTHTKKKLPTPQTVNFETNVIRTAFLWGQDRELIKNVPTEKLKKLKPKLVQKSKILSLEECHLLLSTALSMSKTTMNMKLFYYVFKFMLNSGLRSGELCNLTWDDVDIETRLIKIQPKANWTPKTCTREFYMNDACFEILKSLKKESNYIFLDNKEEQLTVKRLRNAFLRICKRCGLTQYTRVHDLRHTYNSFMQMNGVDAPTMGKILGHKDIETTMIYTHQTVEHLKRMANKVSV